MPDDATESVATHSSRLQPSIICMYAFSDSLISNKVEIIIIIIMNFYSPVSNTRCHSIGHKMRIARIKIRVDSPGRWEKA